MAEWLILDKTTGIGSDEVTITCGSYEELEDRLRNLVFTTVNGRASDTCKVTQKGMVYYLYVNPSSVSIGYTGGTRTITINTNDDWMLSGLPDWVTADRDSGTSGVTTVTLTFTANSGDSARTGTLTVEGEHITRNVAIYQRSESQGDVVIDPDHIDADGCSDGEYTVRIVTDKCWSFDPGDAGKNPIYGTRDDGDIIVIINDKNIIPQGGKKWYVSNNQIIDTIVNKIRIKDTYGNESIKNVVVKQTNFATAVNINDCKYMFYGLTKATGITPDFNTSNVTDMSSMFGSCYKLVSLDLSKFNTSNVTSMSDMFYSCEKLSSLDLSNFDTSSVVDMGGMFNGCSSLTSLDVSNFDTSNVTNMYSMFVGCWSLKTLDITNFNTSNVKNMNFVFRGCAGLKNIELSNFNTSKANFMTGMFGGCSGLTSLDLSKFDTSNVIQMNEMFSGCSNLTSLDLSNFNTSKVYNMGGMFSGCTFLSLLDLSNFDTSNVTASMNYMFDGCYSLFTVKVTNCSEETQNKILSQLQTYLSEYTWALSNGVIRRINE